MKHKIEIFLLIILVSVISIDNINAQNRYEEYIPFDNSTGKLVVTLSIAGQNYPFALDLQNLKSNTISSRLVESLGNTVNDRNITTIQKVGLGEGIFFQQMPFTVIPNDTFTGENIQGTIGVEFFTDFVLTIDNQQQELIITAPFKPEFVQVKNRTDLTAATTSFLIEINGQKISVQLNVLETSGLKLNQKDAQQVLGTTSGQQNITVKIIQTETNIPVEATSQKTSTIGNLILKEGLVSLDYKRGKIYLEPYATLKRPERKQQSENNVDLQGGKTINLNVATFLEHVFNFRQEKEWNYKGDKPAIIDFWADWCGPCKKLSPILEELAANEYKDKVLFYKVNVDNEPEIQRYFKANSLPLLIYIPVNGQPVAIPGLRPKDEIKKTIENTLIK